MRCDYFISIMVFFFFFVFVFLLRYQDIIILSLKTNVFLGLLLSFIVYYDT